jgi:integrase
VGGVGVSAAERGHAAQQLSDAGLWRYVDWLAERGLSGGSLSAYERHWRIYCWLLSVVRPGLDAWRELPSEEDLAAVAALYAMQWSVGSLGQIMSAAQHYAKVAGLGQLPRSFRFGQVQRALKRIYGSVDHVVRKRAVSVADLRMVAAGRDLGLYDHAVFWAMVLIAFWALMRVSEFSAGRLRWEDIVVTEWGVMITIRKGKGQPAPVVLFLAARTDELCPRQALLRVGEHVPQQHRKGPFLRVGPSAEAPRVWGRRKFSAALKGVMERFAGIDPLVISAHSLRRGGYTALRHAGCPPLLVQLHGRWRSDTHKIYLDQSAEATRMLPTFLHAARMGVQDKAAEGFLREHAPSAMAGFGVKQ